MTGALVSVVIPVFNGERYLGEALESVLAQTYRPVEVIVVDDGSTDGSAAIARSFQGVRVLEQARGGPAVARNAGAVDSTGEFLAFHDADDLLPEDKLERQIGHLLEHPEVGCVLGRQELMLEPGVELPEWAKLDPGFAERRPDIVELGAVPLISMVMRRSLFVACGGFDPAYVHGEDADFLLRARERAPVVTLDSVVLRRRVHSGNLSHDLSALRTGTFRVLRDHARRLRAAEVSSDGEGASG
jgi:glycosyltransferase involved in cell wall biosynthesis